MEPTPRPAARPREVLRPSGARSTLRVLLLVIAAALTLLAAPMAAQAAVRLTSMSPQSGPIFGGNLVTVSGTGLDAITGVRNGTNNRSGTITEKSSTTLTFRAPQADQEGGATLAFDSPEGAFQAPSNYMYYPVIYGSPSPSSGPETGGTEIRMQGRDLDQVIAARFSRGVGTIKSQSPTSITIIAPPTDSPYGTTISLEFPNGFAQFPWSYDDVYTPPLVSSLSPNRGSVIGGNPVTIRGQWLWGTKSVTIGTADAPITDSGNGYVTVTAPPGRAGTALVKLTNREGTSVGTVYRYDPLPTPPTVSSLAPNRGPTAGGSSVVVTGTNLATVTSVRFGATVAAIVRKSATSLTVTAPGGAAGAATVTVFNPDGQATGSYTYDAAPPSVSSLAPNRGPIAGGTTVVIAGTNLATVTSVRFGAMTAAIVGKTSTAVTVTAPGGAAGVTTVTVSNPDGQATSSYTYDAPAPPDPGGPTPDPGPTPNPSPTPDPSPTPEPGGSVPNPGGTPPDSGGSVPDAGTGTSSPGANTPDNGSGAPAPSGPAPSVLPTPPELVPPVPVKPQAETTPKCGALSLKGKSLTKATSILRKAGCRRGTVKKPKSVKKGRVLAVATAKLAKGSTTTVNLTLVAKRR